MSIARSGWRFFPTRAKSSYIFILEVITIHVIIIQTVLMTTFQWRGFKGNLWSIFPSNNTDCYLQHTEAHRTWCTCQSWFPLLDWVSLFPSKCGCCWYPPMKWHLSFGWGLCSHGVQTAVKKGDDKPKTPRLQSVY